MEADFSSIHHTEITRIENADVAGWEFVCHSCGYHARYTIDRLGIQKLEIIYVGDVSARHSTGEAPRHETAEKRFSGYAPVEDHFSDTMDEDQVPPDDIDLGLEELLAGGDTLPRGLQEQVEAILAKFK